MKYKRLNFIVDLINNNERVLDVGTDHAFLAIFLNDKYKNVNVDVSDLNVQPLNTAKKNLIENDLLDSVKIILSDGLNNIEPNDYDTIVIAGMGGITISNILKQKVFKGRYVLHPTTDFDIVRKTIYENGMKITNEWIVKERKIHNLIIETKLGNEKISEKDLFLGPILKTKKTEETLNYFKFVENIMLKNIEQSGNNNLYKKELKWIKEEIWNEQN